jgi:hypothetical protein
MIYEFFKYLLVDQIYACTRRYVPLVGDVFLAGTASVRCSEWPLMIYQAGDICPELFQEYPNLLVCSTPLHLKRRLYSSFNTLWKTILNRHHIQSN